LSPSITSTTQRQWIHRLHERARKITWRHALCATLAGCHLAQVAAAIMYHRPDSARLSLVLQKGRFQKINWGEERYVLMQGSARRRMAKQNSKSLPKGFSTATLILHMYLRGHFVRPERRLEHGHLAPVREAAHVLVRGGKPALDSSCSLWCCCCCLRVDFENFVRKNRAAGEEGAGAGCFRLNCALASQDSPLSPLRAQQRAPCTDAAKWTNSLEILHRWEVCVILTDNQPREKRKLKIKLFLENKMRQGKGVVTFTTTAATEYTRA